MRCSLGTKKVLQLRARTGLPVVHAQVRGGTDHRIDLLLEGGMVVHLYKDGTIHAAAYGWAAEEQSAC